MPESKEPLPIALITGGQGDLAQHIARHLRKDGFQVFAPGKSELDVTDAASVKSYFGQLRSVDLLVNNAGVTLDAILARQSEQNVQRVLDVNLRGAFLCSQTAYSHLRKSNQPHIINIGSYSGQCGNVGQTAYAAAKAGLVGLTQSLAKEWGARGIRANCILPGYLETKMTANVSETAESAALGQHTLGRFNTPGEVARFISFLHREMLHTSGQVFQLDSRVRSWT